MDVGTLRRRVYLQHGDAAMSTPAYAAEAPLMWAKDLDDSRIHWEEERKNAVALRDQQCTNKAVKLFDSYIATLDQILAPIYLELEVLRQYAADNPGT